MIKWIISGCLLGLAILFVCLKSVWTGFLYLSLAFLCALCLFWVYIRIKIYIRDYHTNFDKAFVNYKADVLNNTNATAGNYPFYHKQF